MAKSRAKKMGVEKLIAIIFGLIGLVLLVIGIIIAVNRMSFINNADKVTGIVTDIGYSRVKRGNEVRRSGSTEVTYIYEGEEYVKSVSAYSSSIDIGDSIEIYVNRDNPRDIELEPFAFLGVYIVGGIGAVFFLIGMGFLLFSGIAGKKKKRLMTEGRKVYAEVTGGNVNYNVRINGRHPYKLECRYTDLATGAVYLYSSGNIFFDPEPYIGRQVAVYIDRANYSKYVVDTDSLNELAAEGQPVPIHDFR